MCSFCYLNYDIRIIILELLELQCSLASLRSGILSAIFFLTVHWIITVFFRKFSLFIIVFKYKVYDFFDCHLFYSAGNIYDRLDYTGKQKKQKQKKATITKTITTAKTIVSINLN